MFWCLIQINNFLEAFISVNFLKRYFTDTDLKNSLKTMLVTVIGIYVSLSIGLKLEWGNSILTIVNCLILIGYAKQCLKGKFAWKCVIVLLEQMVLPLINIALVFLLPILTENEFQEMFYSDQGIYISLMFLSKLLYALSLDIILFFFQKDDEAASHFYYISIYGIVVCLIAACAFIYSIVQKGNVKVEIMIQLRILFFIIFVLTIFFLVSIYAMNVVRKKAEAVELLQLQNELQEKYIREMERVQRQVSRMRHDYKNHISNIKQLVRKESLNMVEEYLNKLDGYYLKNSVEYINTGNTLLDAILNIKYGACHDQNIDITSFICGDYSKMNLFYFGIILSNLLDNAIEACEEEKEPAIELKIQAKENYVSAVIKNKISKSVLSQNKTLHTTKRDENIHGIGIQHVMELIDQVNGLYENWEEDGKFCIHIMIPLESLI